VIPLYSQNTLCQDFKKITEGTLWLLIGIYKETSDRDMRSNKFSALFSSGTKYIRSLISAFKVIEKG
jgi:hypothetical protein